MMKKFVVVLICSLLATSASAGGEYDEAIAEARKALDEAARQLAELHKKQYANADKKAMLGVLLGEGPMVGGVEIVGTTPDSGAAQAGLEAGDLIVKIGDFALSDVDDPMGALGRYMKDVAPGDVVDVAYDRNGARRSAAITTQARSVHLLAMIPEFDIDLSGIEELGDIPHLKKEIWRSSKLELDRLLEISGDLAAYFDVEAGVIVTEPFPASNLRGGDVVLEIDGQPVKDIAAVASALAGVEKDVEVKVKRRGKDRVATLAANDISTAMDNEVRVIRIRHDSDELHEDVTVEIVKD
jgi:membrane-associated protease RseP (regulator of RpoE activity)